MTDTAAQLAKTDLIGFDPGAEESRDLRRIFVNLRAGRIGQTSDKPIEGYKETRNFSQSGTEYVFYAKTVDHLTGFVDDIQWHSHVLKDGTKLTGWNITVDAGEKGVYVLGIGSNERAFQQAMNLLGNVDFTRTVRFIGFWGKDRNNKPQKVFLITQGLDPETRKPVWVKPVYDQKWLSRLIVNKIKGGVELTEQEERNVSRMKDGSFNREYPYIIQNVDDSWSFDMWNNFLHEQMQGVVIPAVKAAARQRQATNPTPIAPSEDVPNEDVPADARYTGPSSNYDDDIPF